MLRDGGEYGAEMHSRPFGLGVTLTASLLLAAAAVGGCSRSDAESDTRIDSARSRADVRPAAGAVSEESVADAQPGAGEAARPAGTRNSWNRHVSCRAHKTSLRTVLGKQRNRNGGATRAGGGFKPGIPDRRALHPPCRVSGVPTFVQLNHVRVGACTKINEDGDWTCPLRDPHAPTTRPADMKSIHIETDHKFRSRTGWSIPPSGKDIKVQGFVFWDPDHTTAAWHHHSGWEIHSFTAWRQVH